MFQSLIKKEQKNNYVDELFKQIDSENFRNQLKDKQQKVHFMLNFQNRFSGIEFNHKNTLMVVSFFDKINLQGFNSHYKLIKKLIQLSVYGQVIKFLQQSELLVSRNDEQIVIWNNNWQPYQILQLNRKRTPCIITDNQDGIIAGSDNNLIFWKRINFYWNCIQIIDTNLLSVEDLNFNPQQTKLVILGEQLDGYQKSYQIQIIELQDEQWVVTQKIKSFISPEDSYKSKIYFMCENQFLFSASKCVEKFDYDYETKQFIRSKEFKLFDSKVVYSNQESKLLIILKDRQLCFFHRNQKGEYEIQQSVYVDQNFYFQKFEEIGGQIIMSDVWFTINYVFRQRNID